MPDASRPVCQRQIPQPGNFSQDGCRRAHPCVVCRRPSPPTHHVLRLLAARLRKGEARPQQSQGAHRTLQHARRPPRRMGRCARPHLLGRRSRQGTVATHSEVPDETHWRLLQPDARPHANCTGHRDRIEQSAGPPGKKATGISADGLRNESASDVLTTPTSSAATLPLVPPVPFPASGTSRAPA